MKTIFRPLLLALFLGGACETAAAQQAVTAEITRLEKREALAVTQGDATTLQQLWSPDYVVNNPDGRIGAVPQSRHFIRSGEIDYTAFERIMERLTSSGEVAVAMGQEVVQPEKKTTNAGKTVTRRYTNVWVRRAGAGHLGARPATNVVVKIGVVWQWLGGRARARRFILDA
ncbi:nuclear transport factor 2 family protein [Hymenobacter sp. H14-R3]|uniref:nuclear transport factor 2 family protein n=1 Tax=Hymenobacter sp. H14-R3 TaxID=3046308 RepID=UPI0024B8ADDD|nr:nuclear transport factor 2 family protein [Hymenobacter sp. H14-R3]MDJ0365215.1 nuclear transport factor 2 family protein [Hymenobacter sp. H14-R3]